MELKQIQQHLHEFTGKRGWHRYHTPKNLSMALAVEASELMEIFQWMTPEESLEISKDPKKLEAVRDEMADVLSYLVQLSDVLNVDLVKAFWEKNKKNEKKHPEPSKSKDFENKSSYFV